MQYKSQDLQNFSVTNMKVIKRSKPGSYYRALQKNYKELQLLQTAASQPTIWI